MSQLEHDFRRFLLRNPEIEKCHQIVNRRSLARLLIQKGVAQKNQMDAVIAMLRRFQFNEKPLNLPALFKDTKIMVKDNILILEYEKSKELVTRLQKVLAQTNYDKGDTLKLLIGSASITIIVDQENESAIKEITRGAKVLQSTKHISELSILFSRKSMESKGVISAITQEFAINDIIIREFFAANAELLFYVGDKFILKAYELAKRLQSNETR